MTTRDHPAVDDLLDRRDDPDIAAHLDRCPSCRVQARMLARVRRTDPDTLPGIAQARNRLDQAQHQASVTLSASLGNATGDDLVPGTQIDGRYTVEATIGRGGMGTVYRVRHDELGSLHALKVLNWTSPGIRERLIREGRAQSRLRHPNVVPVTDVVGVQGAPGLIMELVDGPSLSDWIRREGRPDIAVADRIAGGILRGVAAAHAAGLVHRDLKPGNVLLAPGDGGPVPKVTDFGLVRLVGPDSADTRLTLSDTPLGTPAYMAPEQLQDASTADARSDVFSLGALLYELVTGRRAFQGIGWLEITDRVRAGQYDPPERLVPDLPHRMARTIERCLHVEPGRRFPDVPAVLAAWTDPDPASASPAAGNRARWFGMAAVLTLVIGLAGGATWLVTRQPGTPAAAPAGDVPTVSAEPGLQRRFAVAWSAFLASDHDTAAEKLSWASPPDAERDTLLATLVYAASLDFAGYQGRAWQVLDEAAPLAAERHSRAARLLRLYDETSYPQAPLDGWQTYLDTHSDDFLAFLLAARVSDGNPDLQRQYYARALALAPAGSTVGKVDAHMVDTRRARRSAPTDGVLRSAAFYPGFVRMGGSSRVWDEPPGTRWDLVLPSIREMVNAYPEDPSGRYELDTLLALTGDEAGRQEQLSALFGPTTNRRDRVGYARGDAWLEFGMGRWVAAQARLRGCEEDAATVMPGAQDGGRLYVQGALCADDRAEMALLLEDRVAAHEAVESLRGWISQPEIPARFGTRMTAGLVYLDARIAVLEGDLSRAVELRGRLVDGDYAYVRWNTGEEAESDLNWRARGGDNTPVAWQYHADRRGQGCLWELGYAEAVADQGRWDEAIGVLEGIASGEACPDGPFVHGFFRARARVLLAEAEAGRGRTAEARAHLDALEAAWPLADPDHPLVARAQALASALE